MFGPQVFVVGLVQHDHHPGGHLGQEGFDGRGRQEGAGRIVGIGDEHQSGVGRDRRRHRIEVVAVVARRHDDRARTDFLGGQCIHRERILRVDDRFARLDKRMRGQFEGVIGAIAQRDPAGRHIVAAGQRRLELETVRIGIAAELAERRHDGLARRIRHAQRVLVGRELDDAVFTQAVLAREFGNGLARLVRSNATDVIGSVQRHEDALG